MCIVYMVKVNSMYEMSEPLLGRTENSPRGGSDASLQRPQISDDYTRFILGA